MDHVRPKVMPGKPRRPTYSRSQHAVSAMPHSSKMMIIREAPVFEHPVGRYVHAGVDSALCVHAMLTKSWTLQKIRKPLWETKERAIMLAFYAAARA
jgi:hypothetical protein